MRTSRPMLLSLAVLLLAFDTAEVKAAPLHDLVLRGGSIIDGSGRDAFEADIAIRNGIVVAIGDLAGASGREELDVSGLVVSPGFLDTHSHAGPGLTTAALSPARPLLAQGITTVFVNPDGSGAVDMVAQREALEREALGVNVAQFVPHGAVRRSVLGMADRQADAAELDAMRALVRAAMEAGAWGLSSGLFYAPGSFAELDEVIALARVAAEFNGVYQSHVRDESDYSIGIMASLEEVVTVGREAALPVVHTHIKALGPNVWGRSVAIVERIEAARAAGVEIYADQYPYLASATSLAAALVPRWAQAGGEEAFRLRMADPPQAARVVAGMEENLARRGGAARIQFRRVRSNPALEGRSLAEVAAEFERTPIEVALGLFARGDPGIVSFNMQAEDVRRLMVQPWMMTASDGGLVPLREGVPHPRSYGTFPRRIRTFVLEQGLEPLEQAIRSMTGLPAEVYGMPDRGVLRVGAIADLAVFDPAELVDPATFTDPHRLAEGMTHVLVAGRFAIRGGAFTGIRAGRVLQRR